MKSDLDVAQKAKSEPCVPSEQNDYSVKYTKNGSRSSKKKAFIIVGIVLALSAVFVFVIISMFGSVLGLQTIFTNQYESHDIAEYMKFEGHIAKESSSLLNRTQLLVFPTQISENSQVNSYYYYCSDAGLDNTYRLFLDYTLPADEFDREVQRLSNLSVAYEGRVNNAIINEDDFEFPAYITTFRRSENSDHGAFEYALVDATNRRIICVLVSEDNLNNMPIDTTIKPPSHLHYDSEVMGFSIYAFKLWDKPSEVMIVNPTE